MKYNKKIKKLPSFWWDFKHYKNPDAMTIIVQSDDDEFPFLGERPANEMNIESAEKFISELKSGRKDFRREKW